MELPRNFRRMAVAVGGGVLLVVGVVGLFLPLLPGTVFCIAGLVLWSSEFPWAKQILTRVRQKLHRLARDDQNAGSDSRTREDDLGGGS